MCFLFSSLNSICQILVEENYFIEGKRSQNPHRLTKPSIGVYTKI